MHPVSRFPDGSSRDEAPGFSSRLVRCPICRSRGVFLHSRSWLVLLSNGIMLHCRLDQLVRKKGNDTGHQVQFWAGADHGAPPRPHT